MKKYALFIVLLAVAVIVSIFFIFIEEPTQLPTASNSSPASNTSDTPPQEPTQNQQASDQLLPTESGSQKSIEKIVIGIPNWPSGRARANILKILIVDNFGLQVELQNGSNAVIFEALDRSAMHIHPETWSPNHDNFTKKYVEENKSIKDTVTDTPTLAYQNICVSQGTAERTGIKSVAELSNPVMAQHFDTDGDGQGEMWIGAVGWGSTPAEKIRAKSYGYNNTMKLKVMEEALAMVEVDAAINKKQNIAFFCYSPHHIFTLHKLKKLKEDPHDPSKWKILLPKEDPQWLEKSYATTAWKSATISMHYSVSLEKFHSQVVQLLNRIRFSEKDMESMSYQLTVKKMPPELFAREWIAKNSSLVDSWLK